MKDSGSTAPRRSSRRRFLEAVGRAGGAAAAVYETMTAMGWINVPPAFAGPPNLPPQHGAGTRVVILGAGIAGLTAGYELGKAGYDVILLEAQQRAGGRSGTLLEPLSLSDLVNSRFWMNRFYQAEEYEWQPTLFQPVDGMDKIWRGFLRTPVGKRVRYRREVTGVFNFDDGGTPKVRVTHRPTGAGGGDEQIVADWCISTIPVPILARVKHNFGADFRAAIAAVAFADTCKVAWQTSSRFWETQHQIYGGISYCTDNITQMWYPSCGYLGRKGILTGAYNYDDDARLMASLDLKARLTLAMKGGRKVHPDFDSHVPADLGVSIAWKQVPHQLGGWAEHWDCDDPVYNRLLRPEGRVFVAGDQVGQLTGWQEGAVRSAHHVMAGITGVRAETPIPTAAPATVSRRRAPTVGRRTRGLP